MITNSAYVRLSARRTLVLALLALVPVLGSAQSPYFTETFDSHSEGLLHNVNDWNAQEQNDARVQSSVKYAGARAGLVATNAVVWRNFSDTDATNVWVDFYAYVTHPTNDASPHLSGSVAGSFFIDSGGQIRAKSNDTWVATGVTVPENAWRRFSVNLDYTTSNWMLYVAGDTSNALATTVATNLAFTSSSTNTYFQAFRAKN